MKMQNIKTLIRNDLRLSKWSVFAIVVDSSKLVHFPITLQLLLLSSFVLLIDPSRKDCFPVILTKN